MYVKCKDILTYIYIYINLFLNCFSYPNEDQAVYDEERQVQRIHVNSNAEKRSQYQAYSEKKYHTTSSGKLLDRSLTFKKRRKKKFEDDDVVQSDGATNLAIDFCQVQETPYNAKHPKYPIQQNKSEQGYDFTTAQISSKLLSLKN